MEKQYFFIRNRYNTRFKLFWKEKMYCNMFYVQVFGYVGYYMCLCLDFCSISNLKFFEN